MSNCLKTQLKEVVQNDNLDIFGVIKYKVKPANNGFISFSVLENKRITVKVFNNTISSAENGTKVSDTEATIDYIVPGTGYSGIIVSSVKETEISVESKYDMKALGTLVDLSINEILYIPLNGITGSIAGNAKTLSRLNTLSKISLDYNENNYREFYGDIVAGLGSNTNITSISLGFANALDKWSLEKLAVAQRKAGKDTGEIAITCSNSSGYFNNKRLNTNIPKDVSWAPNATTSTYTDVTYDGNTVTVDENGNPL